MNTTRRKVIALIAAVFGCAAILGGSLGIAVAGTRENLPTGAAYIGGPRENMAPAKFAGCLPVASWNSIYVWDAAKQQWLHYINPTKVPAYVNDAKVGGIVTIPRLAGLAILIDTAIVAPFFPDTNAQACP